MWSKSNISKWQKKRYVLWFYVLYFSSSWVIACKLCSDEHWVKQQVSYLFWKFCSVVSSQLRFDCTVWYGLTNSASLQAGSLWFRTKAVRSGRWNFQVMIVSLYVIRTSAISMLVFSIKPSLIYVKTQHPLQIISTDLILKGCILMDWFLCQYWWYAIRFHKMFSLPDLKLQ